MTKLALHQHGPTTGIPLVLLHGFPLDSRMWDAVVADLKDLPVLTVDGPGCGASPLPEGAPSLDTYADLLVASLDAAGHHRVVLAGLSMGGYAAMAVAERHPGILAGIGLLDTKAAVDPDEARHNRLAMADAAAEQGSAVVAGMINTMLGPTSHDSRPGVVEQMRQWLAEAPPAAIAWAQRAMAARPDRHAALRALEIPSLVLRGDEDDMSPHEAAASMVDALGEHAVFVEVPQAGHMTSNENPAAVVDALRDLHRRATAN